jgi:hypothetical protein
VIGPPGRQPSGFGIVARFTFDALFWFGLVVAIAIGVWWMILPFLKARRTFRAAATL